MTNRDLSTARNPDLRASIAAMRRAADAARKTAMETDTEIVVVRDGRPIRISAQQLREGQE